MKKIAFLMVFMLFTSVALGRSYNPNLAAFYYPDNEVVDISGFKSYAAELGVAMSPKFLGPASTLGSMGFEVSFNLGLTDINQNNQYWKWDNTHNRPPVADDPGGLLITNQIKIRKGLPYSLQIGGVITHLHQSDLWGIGLEVGWALQEGYRYIPDIAIGGSVNTVLGADDLAMLNVGWVIIASKSFSIAGLFSLVPFAGYNGIYINASTHVTGTFPEAPSGQQASEPAIFVIGQQDIFRHRAIIGLNAVATYVTVGTEIGIAPNLMSYTFKIGATF